MFYADIIIGFWLHRLEWLGRKTFNLATRVRISLESPSIMRNYFWEDSQVAYDTGLLTRHSRNVIESSNLSLPAIIIMPI